MYFSTDRNILNLQKILDHFCPLWLSICYQVFRYCFLSFSFFFLGGGGGGGGGPKGVQIGGPRFVPSRQFVHFCETLAFHRSSPSSLKGSIHCKGTFLIDSLCFTHGIEVDNLSISIVFEAQSLLIL